MRAFLLVAVLALALGGCQTTYHPNLAAATGQVIAAADKAEAAAQKGLAKTCETYPTVHALFVAVSFTGYIPDKSVVAEAQAADYLEALCAAPPTNAKEAYASAKQALATIVSIRNQFRAKT